MSLWNDDFKEGLKGIHCKAEYKEQKIYANRNNPFIETLPDRIDVNTFFDRLYSVPNLKKDYLLLGTEERLDLIQQIRPSFWLPLPNHYERYRAIDNMIKIGYQSRNPMLAQYNREFALGWDQIFAAGTDENGMNKAGVVHVNQSLADIGLSGMGKSKIYEKILSLLFPQVIHHTEYKGRKLITTQVVWLKIECPSDKSLGALCRNFYIAVDKLLGSNFYEKHGDKAGTIDTLAKRMVKVASQINLGLLIIDEIQNIQKAYSGGDDRVINFITELVNTLGIPIIVVGNSKALYMYEKSLSNTRRGLPDNYFENITSFFTEDSWEWNEFIETLWEQQFTVNYTPLSEEVKKTIYHYTLGIPDIVVKLFMHVQAKAILNGGEEKISVSLVKEVASRSLALFTPIAEKIRRGSNNELANLEDVQVDWNSFNEYFKEATYKVNLQGDLKKKHSRTAQKKKQYDILHELTDFASKAFSDIDIEKASEVAKSVYDASGGMGDIKLMYKQITQLALKRDTSNQNTDLVNLKVRKKQMRKPLKKKDDIRLIVERGMKENLTTEESLTKAGLIKSCDEFLLHL